jgi:hemoglobin
MEEDKTLFENLGGRPILERVHKVFYDKLYEHPWLKLFFADIEQKVIEDQQTDFMVSNMGGGKIYSGALPKNAHKHMFVDNTMFDLRQKILQESLDECNVPSALAERWMRIDGAFRKSIVKENPDQCEKRFFTDVIKNYPKP